MPDPCSTPSRHRTAIRVVLFSLAGLQIVDGLYALFAPVSFYEDFPLGRGWVELLPAYSEHLVRDVGGLFLATGGGARGGGVDAAAAARDRRGGVVPAVQRPARRLPPAQPRALRNGGCEWRTPWG